MEILAVCTQCADVPQSEASRALIFQAGTHWTSKNFICYSVSVPLFWLQVLVPVPDELWFLYVWLSFQTNGSNFLCDFNLKQIKENVQIGRFSSLCRMGEAGSAYDPSPLDLPCQKAGIWSQSSDIWCEHLHRHHCCQAKCPFRSQCVRKDYSVCNKHLFMNKEITVHSNWDPFLRNSVIKHCLVLIRTNRNNQYHSLL